jgi:hypothetical protein
MDQQAKFEGWAVVELFGHSKEAGYVTTQYFGDKAMFQIDIPAFEDREYSLERPEWCEIEGRDQLVPKGSKVLRKGTPARSRIVSPGAVYAMNPSSEELVRKLLDRDVPRKLVVLELAKTHQIAAGEEVHANPSPLHEPGCDALDTEDDDDCSCGAFEHVEEQEEEVRP